jgi:four helix bundle protein
MLPKLLSRGAGSARGQLDRASASILLNIAEGSGRFGPAEKAQFYRVARGSAAECAAAVDVLAVRGLLSPELHWQAAGLLARVSQMLTKLVLRMETGPAPAGRP